MQDFAEETSILERYVREFANEPLDARFTVDGERVREQVLGPREQVVLIVLEASSLTASHAGRLSPEKNAH